MIVVWWAAEKELRTQPPIRKIDGLLCILEDFGNGPKVVACVDEPFYVVAFALWCEGAEAVRFRDFCALVIRFLLVFLVVSVVFVDLCALSSAHYPAIVESSSMHTKLANFPHACLHNIVRTIIEYREEVCLLFVSGLDLEVMQTLGDAMVVGVSIMSRRTHLRNRLLLITIWGIIIL